MGNKKSCPVCGEAIIGRIDKKYCSDQCRNEYNNQQNRTENLSIRRINQALLRNRRILEEIKLSGRQTFSRTNLILKGFDFQYHTSIQKNPEGQLLFFCYDQSYQILDEEKLILANHISDAWNES